MNVNDLLAQMGGLSSLSKELELPEEQAASGAAALLPAIIGGFRKEAEAQPTGLAGLGALLGALGGGSLLDEVLAPSPTDVSKGNSVLGKIFGSKDVSRTVAQPAPEGSGLGPVVLRRMLPMLAMLAADYMARQRDTEKAAPPAGSRDTSTGAAGGLADLLGAGSGDGNPVDEILHMAGKNLNK